MNSLGIGTTSILAITVMTVAGMFVGVYQADGTPHQLRRNCSAGPRWVQCYSGGRPIYNGVSEEDVCVHPSGQVTLVDARTHEPVVVTGQCVISDAPQVVNAVVR